MPRNEVRTWLPDLLRSTGLYLLVVVGGTVGFLSIAPLFGYLPYSDRPGPGWYGRFPALGWVGFWNNVADMFGWALLLIPYAFLAGLIVFALTRLLERLNAPRILVRVVAALLAGFVSGYVVLAIGWYIAIADGPVNFACVLGLLHGAFLMPRRRARAAREERSAAARP